MTPGNIAYRGPFYVVLGGNLNNAAPGVYEKTRPPGVTGVFKPLVPIIVVCSNQDDAKAIFDTLHKEIFNVVPSDDAHAMIYLLQHQPATTLELKVKAPMFAIRAGAEPGVYIGFEWQDLTHNIEGPAKKHGPPAWRGFPNGDLVEALTFMIKKPGANLPLVPAGTPYPPPPSARPKQLRFDFSTEETSSGVDTENTRPTTPAPSAAPPKSILVSSRAGSPVKGGRAGSDTSAFPLPPSLASSSSASAALASSSSSPAPAALASSSSSSSASGAASSSVPSARNRLPFSAATKGDIIRELPIPYGVGDEYDPLLRMLRRFVRLPASMGGATNPRLPALNFGETADELLLGSGLDAQELLTLLQVRVHSTSVEMFTHHIGMTLGWSTRKAATLWTLMELPELY